MLLIKNTINEHVSSDVTNEFESVILSDENVIPATISKNAYKVAFFVFRVARKFGVSTILKTKKYYLKNPIEDSKHLFTVMMGLDENKYKEFGFTTNHCRSIYLFDAWPKDYDKIIHFVEKYKINFAFITARKSAEELNKRTNKTTFFWIPEGIKKDEYKHKPYAEKNIDVLAIGRKYDLYHNQIKKDLEKSNIKYLYEKQKGEIIFPTREEFVDGLADAKISICIPSNITHPERSGNVETMTIRYLQSILSKCLIVGHAPAEMIDLFGYNPVIEIDYRNPTGQIINILNNYESYIPFVEKNYASVIEKHTWEHRWNQIKNIYSNYQIR